MASPQVEEGFTRIANELLEHLMAAPLGGAEWSCVMLIIRRSWGWGNREAEISLKQFVAETARDVESIRDALSRLQKKRIIAQVAPPAFDRAASWRLEKDWELWEKKDKVGIPAAKGGLPKKPHSPQKTTLSHKNHTPEGVKNHTPPSGKNHTPISKSEPKVQILQEVIPARKLQKERLKKVKEKKGNEIDGKAVDVRFVPLRDYFFEQFQKARGYHYRPVGEDLNALKKLVLDTRWIPDYELDKLKSAMHRFLDTKDKFHLSQGKPLSYFCRNVHAFMISVETGHSIAHAHVGKGVDSKESAEAGRKRYAEFIREKPVGKRNPDEIRFLEAFDSGAMDG